MVIQKIAFHINKKSLLCAGDIPTNKKMTKEIVSPSPITRIIYNTATQTPTQMRQIRGLRSFASGCIICNCPYQERQLMELFGFNPYAIDQSSVNCAAVCFVCTKDHTGQQTAGINCGLRECRSRHRKSGCISINRPLDIPSRMQIKECDCVCVGRTAHRCMHGVICRQTSKHLALCASASASPAASDAGAARALIRSNSHFACMNKLISSCVHAIIAMQV